MLSAAALRTWIADPSTYGTGLNIPTNGNKSANSFYPLACLTLRQPRRALPVRLFYP